MQFRHRRNIPTWIQGLIIIAGMILIAVMFIYEKAEEKRIEQHILQVQEKERERRAPSDENSINVLQDSGFVTDLPEQGKLILSS